ncbi:MAG: phosphate ABC transporter permease subunit PstC [Acholeplasmataceae bacterium]|nr:MAG: phosphate ABC transporter permease subunit PstC [Acholeplasmataceae bacterium]
MNSIRTYVTPANIRHKNRTDKLFKAAFLSSSLLSASFIVMIVLFIAFKGVSPFIRQYEGYNNLFGTVILPPVNPIRFLTGMQWLDGPLLNTSGYAIGYAIVNTLIAVFLAIMLVVPIAVLTALFIAKVAPKPVSKVMRTVVELLAAIPSIVYGVFGLGIITKITIATAGVFNVQTAAGLSLMSTVLVLAIMILPTITAISETSIRSVDSTIIEGSLALGASEMQTYYKVVLTSAKSGIFAGIILGVGRALGEATAVAMVSGNAFSGIQTSLFGTTATLTSRMLLGLKDTTGLDYDIRFSVGLVLMAVILITNFTLRAIMRKVGNLDA